MAGIKCHYCKTNNPSSSNFCINCGKRIEITKENTSSQSVDATFILTDSFLRQRIRNKAKFRVIIGIISIVLVFYFIFSAPEDNGLFWVLNIILIFFTIRRLVDLDEHSHYIYQLASKIPGINGIDDLSAMLVDAMKEKEIEFNGSIKLYGDIFFYEESFWSIEMYYLPLCTWIYKRVTSNKAYGLITVSKDYHLIMHFPDNKTKEISGSEEQVNNLLYKAALVCPNAKLGYT